jgi:hypothetical protein
LPRHSTILSPNLRIPRPLGTCRRPKVSGNSHSANRHSALSFFGRFCMGVQPSGLLSKGSRLLPDQSRQPPPEGAHTPPAGLFGAPPVAKTENFSSTRFHPHLGHSGGSWLRVNTSFSKTCPQLEQAYSKIGMGYQSHSFRTRHSGPVRRVASPWPHTHKCSFPEKVTRRSEFLGQDSTSLPVSGRNG